MKEVPKECTHVSAHMKKVVKYTHEVDETNPVSPSDFSSLSSLIASLTCFTSIKISAPSQEAQHSYY